MGFSDSSAKITENCTMISGEDTVICGCASVSRMFSAGLHSIRLAWCAVMEMERAGRRDLAI